jgi:predicted type IV restriction endonuclease
MPASHNEAFSRILIDKALESSGWDLLDARQVMFEQKTTEGRIDYL